MDEMQMAALQRARHAVNVAMSSSTATPAAEFVRAVKHVMKSSTSANVTGDLDGTDLRKLAASFIATIANRNLLDGVLRFATVVPEDQHNVMTAVGSLAGEVGENMPKAVRRLSLSVENMDQRKIVALLVASRELLDATGAAGERMFRRELENSLIAASNEALLNAIPVSTSTVTATGNVLADLRAGLEASDDSEGFIVAASRSVVRSLALDAEGRMSAIVGGEYVPGVLVIPSAETTYMMIIPASRLAIQIDAPHLKNASHASIMMADDPTSPAELVSLFQTNSKAIAIERRFRIRAEADAIEVAPSG